MTTIDDKRAALLADVAKAASARGWMRSEVARLMLTLAVLPDARLRALVSEVKETHRGMVRALVL